MNKLVTITIPIYKREPDKYELISLMQCIKILNKYDFAIVCPQNLNVVYYENLLKLHNINYSIQQFDNSYFESIDAYNLLMLNLEFYDRFKTYQHILIYQLDAYVFKDELKYWCSLDYDYIGAPWIRYQPYGTDLILKKVGNGGLSLRRTQVFIDRLNYQYPLKSLKRIWKDYGSYAPFQKALRIPIMLFRALGYKNTMRYFSRKVIVNEDAFWCVFLENTKHKLNLPDIDTAAKFSVETGAKQFYESNQSTLPFGCHAWQKQESNFWRNFIPFP